MIVLQAQNITKSFGADIIFKDVTFIINNSEKIGLVGSNGAGKSTLLKCLIGRESLESGKVMIGKDLNINYLAQSGEDLSGEEKIIDLMLSEFKDIINLKSEIRKFEKLMSDPEIYENKERLQSIMENYSKLLEKYERQGGYSFESKIKGMLKGLGFKEDDFNRSVNTFSGGQKTRLALAKILLRQPDLILLDEPTNYLDIESVEWLENYLAAYPGALLIVSHDRYFLDKVAGRILDLQNKELISYPGNYSKYLRLKEQKMKSDEKSFQKQQGKIKHLEEYVSKYKAGIKSKQARGRQKQLDKLYQVTDRPQAANKKAAISFNMNNSSGEKVLELENIKKSYDGKVLFNNLNFKITKGEKIALIGKNGTGKTTLLKIITSDLQFQGNMSFGSRVKIAYFDQEHNNLNESSTVMEEIYTGPHITENEARSVLGRFLFSGEEVEKRVNKLSGGEKSRLVFAKLFLQNANFFILDEPTNHLDVNTCEILEDALEDFQGTILFVSHDRYFINRLATKVVEIENNNITEYQGDYDYYYWKKNDLLEEKKLKEKKEQEKREQEKKEKSKPKKKAKKNNKKPEITISELENKIEELEIKVEEMTHMLSDNTTYTNLGDDVKNLTEEYNTTNSELQKLYEIWEKKIEEN